MTGCNYEFYEYVELMCEELDLCIKEISGIERNLSNEGIPPFRSMYFFENLHETW